MLSPHICCSRLCTHNIIEHALQVIELDHDFGDTFGGVLTNSEGHMTALWANFNEQAGNDDMEEYCRGIPIPIIKPWLQQVQLHQMCHSTQSRLWCIFPRFLDLVSSGEAKADGQPPAPLTIVLASNSTVLSAGKLAVPADNRLQKQIL